MMNDVSVQLQIANYLQAVQRVYPYGAPSVQITKKALIDSVQQKLIFYSLVKLNDPERQLLNDAAQKGLLLSSEQYEISDTGKIPSHGLVVVFGDRKEGEKVSSELMQTFPVSEIISDPSKKRIFWQELKRLWQHT